jgi:hypothetical protein
MFVPAGLSDCWRNSRIHSMWPICSGLNSAALYGATHPRRRVGHISVNVGGRACHSAKVGGGMEERERER